MKIKGFPSDEVAWGLIALAAVYVVGHIIVAVVRWWIAAHMMGE